SEFPQIAALAAGASETGASETPLVPQLDLPAAVSEPAPLVIEHGHNPAAGSQTIASGGATLPLLDAAGDVVPLEAVESAAIRFAIAHYRGQMSEVARKLRIGRSTLYRKIESLGLAAGDGKADVAGR